MPNVDHSVMRFLLVRCTAGAPMPLAVPAIAELTVAQGPLAAVQAMLEPKWRAIFYDLDSDADQMLELAASLGGISAAAGENGPPARIGLSSRMRIRCGDAPDGLDAIVDGHSSIDWVDWFSRPKGDAEPTDAGFDPEDLIERMMGNEVLAKRIVGVFLEDAPRQLLALSDALDREDAALGARIAHSIRGAASNAGGEAMVPLVRAIENGCSAGNVGQAKETMPELKKQFSRLRPLLERFST